MNTETMLFNNVKLGDSLPPLDIPITSALIVGGAMASRDFTPVHHDKSKAKEGGLPDVFMNILTSNGLMGRYVTDWSGPNSTLKKVDIKLGAPNLPGFVMTISGEVVAIDEAESTVDIAVVGENNVWGMHMQGTVRVALPTQEGGS